MVKWGRHRDRGVFPGGWATPRPTCVLAPEGDPVWPLGASRSFHSIPSCLRTVLRGPALLREQLGGGGLGSGT